MRDLPLSFEARDRASVHEPAYGYVIDVNGTKYHLTSFDRDVIVNNGPAEVGSDPQTFTAAQIWHAPGEQSLEFGDREITVNLGLAQGAAADDLRALVFTSAKTSVSIRIIRMQIDGDASGIDWDGNCYLEAHRRVVGYSFPKEFVLRMALGATSESSTGLIPVYRYVATCQAPLYGARMCGIDRDAEDTGNKLYRIDTTLTAVRKPQLDPMK